MVRPYLCIRCGYETTHFTAMKNHLYNKLKPCPPSEMDIELTEEVKQCIMEKRGHNPHKADCEDPTCLEDKCANGQKNIHDITDALAALREELTIVKKGFKTLESKVKRLETFYNKRSESYYQKILEKYLNGRHKKLPSGVTDVTNERVHAEIKVWNNYKAGIGQLACYNKDDPKEELHIYFFGEADAISMERITEMCIQNGVRPFEFQDYAHKTDIVDLRTSDVVYVHMEPVPQNSSPIT